ncbi:MAG: hypothetical protein AAGM67_09665, partial [Bacteroidota bacterium]
MEKRTFVKGYAGGWLRAASLLLMMLCLASLLDAQPVVNLGNDTTICGGTSLLLDAGNAGATYTWSTTETSQTINVSSSGIYWVDVTDGSGTTRDSIKVNFLIIPSDPTISDLTVCRVKTQELIAGNTAERTLWYDAQTNSNVVAVGDTARLSIPNTTTFYVQTFNSAGFQWVGEQSPANLLFAGASRGMSFTVLQPINLANTVVYTNGPVSFELQIRSLPSQTIVLQKNVSLSDAGRNEIALYQDLPPGNYTISAVNISSVLAFTTSGLAYPYEAPGLFRV